MDEYDKTGLEIAVIGMAGRFPGAKNIDEFWDNLKNGRETICFFSMSELEEAGVPPDLFSDANYIKASGILVDIDCFDASFFGYTPREAELMDPQIRVFHECIWTAMEDAGYDVLSYDGLIGLYAGASPNLDWEARTLKSGKYKEIGNFLHLIHKDFLTLRISYKLNLVGPAFGLYTACSTSLAAIHIACQAILNGECDMALAGGITLSHLDKKGYYFQEGMIASPDGHCRAFDARAKGTVGGDGAGIVVLKRLEEAISDRDYIHALVKGSAMNNDGLRKVGFTAPSVEGQGEVIKMALQMAEVVPESIGYIEAHGTGTRLGDPVEMDGLRRAFQTNKKRFCAVGSVKSNLGHLDSAAGVAGFIKTVLALKHRSIPPTLHFETPNSAADFENSPFYINTTLKEWKSYQYPLRAGVSSCGIGGTNVHVILEETPRLEGTGGLAPLLDAPLINAKISTEYQLILLSAKTQTALDKMTKNLAEYFKKNLLNPGSNAFNLADAAFTLQLGRRSFKHRKMFVCSGVEEAIGILSSTDSRKIRSARLNEEKVPVIFLFPGLDSQYVNMGLGIYQTEPVFRREMDRCFEILKSLMDYDIKEILYPHPNCRGGSPCPPKHGVGSPRQGDHRGSPLHSDHINQTGITQPVIFTFEYSLAKLLMKWGVKPEAMIGYSFGEYTAACISGVFSLEDALRLIVSRGKLIERVAAGSMLSVPLSVQELEPLLSSRLSIAIDNGQSCIVAGSTEAIDAFEKKMRAKKYLCMRLQSSRAIHSKMMEPILKDFESIAAEITLNKPQIPYISNVTGDWLTPPEAPDPGYWSRHLRETVRFADGIKHLIKKENAIFIELGPGRDLGALLRRYLDKDSNQKIINLVRSLEKKTPDDRYLLSKIGQLWLYGVNIDWSEFYREEKRCRIPLPTYPFQDQRYWIEGDFLNTSQENLSQKSFPVKRPGIADWFYIPSWERTLLPPVNNDNRGLSNQYRWLVFLDRCGIGSLLLTRLKVEGCEVITVKVGTEFKRLGDNQYQIRPQECQDYEMLFNEPGIADRFPNRIVHLWGVGENEDIEIQELQYLGFKSLLFLIKALVRKDRDAVVEISVVTSNMQEVTGEEKLCPIKAAVISPVLVIPQEHPTMFCRSLDIILPESGSYREKKILDQLLAELLSQSLDRVIAFRGNHRLVRVFKPVHLGEIQESALPLREEGIYLIIGGLGKVGLIIAEYLSKRFRAKLILTGRTAFPARDMWENWLTTHDKADPVSGKIRKLKELESRGAKLMIFSADAAEQEEMKMVIHEAEKQFGNINGVIYLAGQAEGETFQVMEKIEENQCEQHFRAKVYGVIALENLFRDKELDFCWLMSSVSTVLGGLKFAAYAAANAFMDAYVNKYNQLNETRWISVDWDDMGPRETVICFQRILSLPGLNHVVVSEGGNLQDGIDKGVKREIFRNEDNFQQENVVAAYPRPDLSNPYIAPRNQVEREMVSILQNLFGFEEIGIKDDFFELGGDSLKAIIAISSMHKTLNVEIPLPDFFKRPTVELLAQFIDQAEKSTYSSIEALEKKEYYSLSPAQRRLYIFQQMDLTHTGYNIINTIGLKGKIEKTKLEGTFRRIIMRHEILRTFFLEVNGKSVQRIHDEVEFKIEYDDLQVTGTGSRMQVKEPFGQINAPGEDLATEDTKNTEGTRGLAPLPGKTAERKEECHAPSAMRDANTIKNFIRPFDLSCAPLLRVGLIKENETTHIFVVDMHHIISDWISHQLLTQEFLGLYARKHLEPLRIQYKDYSQWLNHRSDKKNSHLKNQKVYWMKVFAGEIPQLNMPTDYNRPLVKKFNGHYLEFVLDAKQTKQLKKMAKEEETTLAVIFLTIYYIFLFKYTRQEDIVVGMPIHGRKHPDLQHMVGMFVNMLALRNQPKGKKTFKGFLSEIKESLLASMENQDYPFEELVTALKTKRTAQREPLFDVVFNMINLERSEKHSQHLPTIDEDEELKAVPYKFTPDVTVYDLILTVVETPGSGFIVSFGYSTDLFGQPTVKKMIKRFIDILNQVLENKEITLKDIKLSHGLVAASSNKRKQDKHHFGFI